MACKTILKAACCSKIPSILKCSDCLKYKESKLRKEIIAYMKDFILEMGKDADMEVVRYALNRSMSPTMVALYKEQLQAGGVIKRSLEEFCNYLTEGKSKN